ncbi:MAG: fimbrillin family protein [Alistipes sp.]|jgi:uncharacterized protein (TIGR02145 family)|nr:fimbrillin family protein [Alistipes sp.]
MKRILFLCTLPMLLAGCATDIADIAEPNGGGKTQGERIEFKIGFAEGASEKTDAADPQTRVIAGTDFKNSWEDGDMIGIYAKDGDQFVIENAPLTYDKETDSWSGDIFWPEGVGELSFNAFYPYSSLAGNIVRVRQDQSTAQNHRLSNVLVSADTPPMSAGEAVPLSFSPANALIQLTIDDPYETLDPDEELTVTLRGVWISFDGGLKEVNMFRMADGVTFRAFVFSRSNYTGLFPVAAGTSMFLIQSGDKTFQSTPLSEEVWLIRGRADLFELRIPVDPARLTDPGVIVGGLKWATRNVERPGMFAATPYTYDYQYQYFWEDAVNPANGTGTDGSICPAGWRMPTQLEYKALMAAATNTGPVEEDGEYYTSNPGWVNSEPRGMNVVTPGGTLFFAASGYLYNGGASGDRGVDGDYWTSTSAAEVYENHARILSFDNLMVSTRWNSNGRDVQISVRCVQTQ